MKHLGKTIFLSLAMGLVACANGIGPADAPDAERDGAVADPATPHDDASGEGALRPTTSDAGAAYDAALRDGEPRDSAGSADATLTPDSSTAYDASTRDSGVLVDSGASDSSTPTCAAHGFSGVLATFDLVGQPGNEDVAPATSVAAGVRVGSLSRSTALNASAATGSISSTNWGMGQSADPNTYYALVITPTSGCSIDATSLALDMRSSNAGPESIEVATNADGFARHFGTFGGTGTTTVAFPRVGGAGPLEIRIYGYGASSSVGTLRIQNVPILSGEIR